jgi:hypothetical protein
MYELLVPPVMDAVDVSVKLPAGTVNKPLLRFKRLLTVKGAFNVIDADLLTINVSKIFAPGAKAKL